MRRLAVVGLLLVAPLAVAGGAVAAFTSSSTAAPQALGSATLAAPAAPSAASSACVANKSIQANVTWSATASPSADGYEVLRSTNPSGPFASVGTVAGWSTTTFADATVTFSTTYYYVVEAKKNAWRSADSAVAAVTTASKTCK